MHEEAVGPGLARYRREPAVAEDELARQRRQHRQLRRVEGLHDIPGIRRLGAGLIRVVEHEADVGCHWRRRLDGASEQLYVDVERSEERRVGKGCKSRVAEEV